MGMTISDEDPERVLIVDDDPDVGRLLVMQISATGRETRFTDDPEEFLRQCRKWSPAFVVVDLVMPKMDGLEVLAQLAKIGSAAKVIITSGMGGRVLDASRRFADANGLTIAGVLGKPYTKAELIAVFEPHPDHPHLKAPRPIGVDEDWPSGGFQAAFRTAVTSDQIAVVYQPKVKCSDRSVVGYEALARWTHPERGAIPPAEFVPAAEGYGLVSLLTDRVMRDALDWFGTRKHAPGIHLSVNISATEFDEPGFEHRFLRACTNAKVPPGDVILELTETSTMADPEQSLKLLTRLRLLGFQLSLDDFGTGYSSMVQLAQLPFTEIKVDQSFVTNSASSHDSLIVARSIIELGHSLSMNVTAEGVEDEDVIEALAGCGCDFAQGYHLARPMHPEELDSWADGWSI
jgi:EAL domain-containing protein (putative c-di-GMP-specific phosphodiesterase class I)/ActR/RegA family two-component response regulator